MRKPIANMNRLGIERMATGPPKSSAGVPARDPPRLLCLKCRGIGHGARDCSSTKWSSDQFGWFLSGKRLSWRLPSLTLDTEDRNCDRCEGLDLLRLFSENMLWETAAGMNQVAQNGIESFLQLGKTGSVEFMENCPLCRCLFAITPSPSSPMQDIFVIPDWTMNRLTGETPTVTETDGWSEFGKCIVVGLDGGSGQMEFSTRIHRGDALAMLEDGSPPHLRLGGRLIHPTELDMGMICGWLTSCAAFHDAKCVPEWPEELQEIKLVDVDTRRVVTALNGRFDYIALSYVWGGVRQQGYRLGSELGVLPRTIEDAMEFTHRLGKRYLWVDSLCIDQDDPANKERQIKIMDRVYQGAYLTLIALSGTSANSCLPRLRLGAKMQPQVSCTIKGKRLVGLMPTLSQQIWRSPWGSRAWTLQEGLLSPRCLYVSEHQLYFECNGM